MSEDLGAQYRAAKSAVEEHVRKWAAAGIAKQQWLKAHRHLPASRLFHPVTGEPQHPELVELHAAEEKSFADSLWCRALVVACGELIKGRSLEDILADGMDRAAAVADALDPAGALAQPTPEVA